LAELKVDISAEPRIISAVRASLTPETDDNKRCKLSLRTDRTGSVLSLILKSGDLISLRAGLNTNLRLAATALRSVNAARNLDSPEKSQKD
jgi:tRNA threonylcarbamoyladenosine modification (KEOPS) complex  Pcc1 subunit